MEEARNERKAIRQVPFDLFIALLDHHLSKTGVIDADEVTCNKSNTSGHLTEAPNGQPHADNARVMSKVREGA